MSGRFSPEVDAALREAGWTPDRRLPAEDIAAMRRAVADRMGTFGGRLDDSNAADPVLAEFGGLVIDGGRDGVDLAPRPFVLDPTLAAGSVETLIDVGRAMGTLLYPLGVEGLDEAVLAITNSGKIVSVDPTGEWLLGDTVEEALDVLVTGRRPRRVAPGNGRQPLWQPPPATEPDDLLPLGPSSARSERPSSCRARRPTCTTSGCRTRSPGSACSPPPAPATRASSRSPTGAG
ncbi:SUKH-3 domain-containing protein [Phytohabitans rumicis]|uniref:SUKH-3 domain-containing protein n=1 Tax=Phytohabitans rumicis TaxID=1076125 RepID=A0A6V8LBA6_9ACTN|nr:SUKH-3 domain-containing protein [Phytohabitans rumicis]GFJ91839.1 hypothetical protein Prum_054810 [Phytohabitans rumicis]